MHKINSQQSVHTSPLSCYRALSSWSLVLSNQIQNYLYLYLFIGLSEINSKVLSVYRDKKFHTDNGKPNTNLLKLLKAVKNC